VPPRCHLVATDLPLAGWAFSAGMRTQRIELTARSRLVPLGPMAIRAGVPARWLKEEAEAGRLPALRAGSRFLFDPDVTLRLLEERARPPERPETSEGDDG